MIRIVYLYPRQLNIYGDYGNVIALSHRAQWRKITIDIIHIGLGDTLKLKPGDILFIGGGQDQGQNRVAEDLSRHKTAITQAVDSGMPALAICGGYQLFGNFFRPNEGKILPGIGVFDADTVAQKERFIGNVVLESSHFGRLVGFENHSGRTTLADTKTALGHLKQGFGNNGHDKTEGIIKHNAIGTYLHGSFLPKNPQVADFLLRQALLQKGDKTTLRPLDDQLEQQAATKATKLSY